MQVLASTDALVSGGNILGRSPLDGTALEPVAATPPDAIADAVKRARAAQKIWNAVSPWERGKKVKALAGEMLARAPAWAELMRREQGKSAVEAYTSEIVPSADLFAYWAKQGPRLLEPEAYSLNPLNFPKKAGVVELLPKGVIALIAPWNFPVSIPLRTLVPALIAGNAVVFKPSEYAPRIGAAVAELFGLLGVADLVQCIQGPGEAGARVLEAGVDHVVFTGSVPTGRRVAQACADRLIGCSLELGGKDPAIVLHDADLERSADGIVWGAFMNAGQNCASVERVYVVQSVAPRFIELVLERCKKLVLSGPGRQDFDVGPLVRPAGLETVKKHVADAVQAGAVLRCGGKATGAGLGFEPTVLTDVTDDMAVMQEETFGPVMPIAVVKDEDEAIARANQSVYGLTASVWTRDVQRGRALARQLEVGVVTINNHGFTAALPYAPWHGRRDSGHGTTNSKVAFYDFVEPHFVLIDRNRQKEMWWFPHNAAFRVLSAALAELLGKRGRKLAALLTVLKTLPRRWKD